MTAAGWGYAPPNWTPRHGGVLIEGVVGSDLHTYLTADDIADEVVEFLRTREPVIISRIYDAVPANRCRVRNALYQLEVAGEVIRLGACWTVAP